MDLISEYGFKDLLDYDSGVTMPLNLVVQNRGNFHQPIIYV